MARLKTYVEVDGTWYGPSTEVPDHVAVQITNPKAWAEAPAPDPVEDASPLEQSGPAVKEPPRGGPGSSASAWRTFLESHGFEVPADATAKDMQAAWDNRDKSED